MPQFVMAYDISDDQRRRRVARTLVEYGERVQESVFLATLSTLEQQQLRCCVGVLLRGRERFEMFPIDQRLSKLRVAWNRPVDHDAPVRLLG